MEQEIKSEFEKWLSRGNVKKYAPAFVLNNLLEVSAYAMSKSMSKVGIFDIISIHQFNDLRNKLLGNKIFRFTQKNTYYAFEKISKLYADFLKQQVMESQEEKLVDDSIPPLEVVQNKSKEENERTIVEAVSIVLQENKSLTAKEICDAIIERNLYVFSAKAPTGVVLTELMRHCKNQSTYTIISKNKLFEIVGENGKSKVFSLVRAPEVMVDCKGNIAERTQRTLDKNLASLDWNDRVAGNFYIWLLEQAKSEATARQYASNIKRLVFRYKSEFEAAKQELNIQEGVRCFIKLLKINPQFVTNEAAPDQHNRFTAALKMFNEFCGNSNNININKLAIAKNYIELPTINKFEQQELLFEIENTLNSNYPNGFAFVSTSIRLLSELVNFKITDEVTKILKGFLFHRDDDLYFCPSLIATKETNIEFVEKAKTWVDEYDCFEICKLYEQYSNRLLSSTIIRDEEDFAVYYEYVMSKEMSSYSLWGHKIYALPGLKRYQIEMNLAKRLSDAIIECGGIITVTDIAEKNPAISVGLIAELLKCYQKTVIKTEINGIPCYQSFDALGLPIDFLTILGETIDELDKIEVIVSEDTLHTALSLRMCANFKKEYNIQDNKTYRYLIAAYYDAIVDADSGRFKREWNRGIFSIAKGEN